MDLLPFAESVLFVVHRVAVSALIVPSHQLYANQAGRIVMVDGMQLLTVSQGDTGLLKRVTNTGK
jgi:hypothetical protein